jgi:hypothetical protein
MSLAPVSWIHPPAYTSGRPNHTRAALALLQSDAWQERMYRLKAFIEVCEGLPPDSRDVFFTPNAFGKQRRLDCVAQLNALFVDLDPIQPTLFQSRDFLLSCIRDLVPAVIPQPNILVCSGRGHWLLWLLEPTPSQALPLWLEIEAYLVRSLAHLGADPKAKDVTRVMRLPGTINSKSGQRVTFEQLHQDRYRLDQLAAGGYLQRKPKAESRPLAIAVRSKPREETPVHPKLFTLYSLHKTIIEDLQRLADLRGRKLAGHRQYFLFVWRNCLARLGQSAEESERQLRSVALQYLGSKQIPDREWMRTTMSAYRAKHTTAHGDEATGYTLRNSWIIEHLNITPEEQRHMQTLIQRAEKYRRKNESRRERSREEFLQQAADKRIEIRQLRVEYPEAPVKKIAYMANVSVRTVWNALKQ